MLIDISAFRWDTEDFKYLFNGSDLETAHWFDRNARVINNAIIPQVFDTIEELIQNMGTE